LSESLKELQDAANRLVTRRRQRDPLPAPVARPAIGEGVGFAEPQQPKAGTARGGIAWPLTEESFESREKHPEEIIVSADGIFTASINRYKSLSLRDAAGTKGQIILKPKPAPPEE
jgi:hypothetical protein